MLCFHVILAGRYEEVSYNKFERVIKTEIVLEL